MDFVPDHIPRSHSPITFLLKFFDLVNACTLSRVFFRYRAKLYRVERARVHAAWRVGEFSETVALQLASGGGGGLVDILEKQIFRHAPLRWLFDETVHVQTTIKNQQ